VYRFHIIGYYSTDKWTCPEYIPKCTEVIPKIRGMNSRYKEKRKKVLTKGEWSGILSKLSARECPNRDDGT
jgi:hypothetical protein